jgi:hypothetical protein
VAAAWQQGRGFRQWGRSAPLTGLWLPSR